MKKQVNKVMIKPINQLDKFIGELAHDSLLFDFLMSKQFDKFENHVKKMLACGKAEYEILLNVLPALRGDMEHSKQLIAEDAEQNALAQYFFGFMCCDSGDNANAEKYLKKSAEQDFAPAQFILATFYSHLNKTHLEKEWLLKAAQNGHAGAQMELGQLYEKEENLAKAKEWYLKAAENGMAVAMCNLGWIAHQEVNMVEARKWHHKAAEIGEPNAQIYIGMCLMEDGALAEAKMWLKKAIGEKHPMAYAMLAKLYLELGDPREAKKWARRGLDIAKDAETKLLLEDCL